MKPRTFRAESFGGIVQLTTPRALVFVDAEYARSLGEAESPLWSEPERAHLSGPVEAHLTLTDRCGVGCRGCYVNAKPDGGGGDLEAWTRALDAMAARGVFHLALGGGESATLPWLGELARRARARQMVPNLTTSGLEGLDDLLPIAPLFGQINVSIDGIGAGYEAVRGVDGFAQADHAVRALRERTPHVGINCVVTRQNFDSLGAIVAYAKKNRLNEVELLRFKPSGRGRGAYADLCCTEAQHMAILPTALGLAKKHRMRIKLDCSYAPMVCAHSPEPELLRFLAVLGCVGGDFLIGAKPDGRVTGCSFAMPAANAPRVEELDTAWDAEGLFAPFRAWRARPEPCRSCKYLDICRGGCRAVATFVSGDANAPDPECPLVLRHAREQAQAERSRNA